MERKEFSVEQFEVLQRAGLTTATVRDAGRLEPYHLYHILFRHVGAIPAAFQLTQEFNVFELGIPTTYTRQNGWVNLTQPSKLTSDTKKFLLESARVCFFSETPRHYTALFDGTTDVVVTGVEITPRGMPLLNFPAGMGVYGYDVNAGAAWLTNGIPAADARMVLREAIWIDQVEDDFHQHVRFFDWTGAAQTTVALLNGNPAGTYIYFGFFWDGLRFRPLG